MVVPCCAVAFGKNDQGHCAVPPLDDGMTYTSLQVARQRHTVLRSDGSAVAFGFHRGGQCDLPLSFGQSYFLVSAGWNHSMFIQSDGQVVFCGDNSVRVVRFLQAGVTQCF